MVNLLSKSLLIVLDELEYRLAKLIERRLKKRALRKERRSREKRFEEGVSVVLQRPDEPVTSPSDLKDEITWVPDQRN